MSGSTCSTSVPRRIIMNLVTLAVTQVPNYLAVGHLEKDYRGYDGVFRGSVRKPISNAAGAL